MTVVKDTTLELVVGDSEDFLLTLKDENGVIIDLSKAVDGTASRPAVIRFAVKDNADDDNAQARVYKTTFTPNEVQILTQSGATLGLARILVDKPDTEAIEPSQKRWDCEVTRQDFLRTVVGTVALVAGSNIVNGAGTDFTKAKVGDVLMPTGGANVTPALITKITSAAVLEVESGAAFTASEATSAFEIRRGKSRTTARGNISLVAGIVKK